MTDKPAEFSKDLLHGADEIADFLFGDPKERRRIYYLAAKTRFPAFKIGSAICARRSKLMEWVRDQEELQR